MSVLDGVEIALGALILLATLYDVFQSVVMPRPAVGRLRVSPELISQSWRAWRGVAQRPRKLQTREAALAAFAPFMIVALLVLWGFLLILGYALVFSGLHSGLQPQPASFGETLYFSTGRMLAFGVDGVQAVSTATSVLTGLEAASGFGLFALVISLLFALFNAFQRREAAVVALDALAGAPPSAIQLLETCAHDTSGTQLTKTFDEWRVWSVDVLESHLSYPLLLYFRSSHDNEAWPNSFGAVMDAALFVITTIKDGPVLQARLLYKVGAHLVEDMRGYYRRLYSGEPVVGIEQEEFLEACDRLQLAGYRLQDRDLAWEQFSDLRRRYALWLNRTARALAVPPAPWIGDRSYLPHRERPARRRTGTRPAA